ncbi:MAG: phosphatase PAP2 family protein [Rubrivivax sp.]
MKGDPTHIGFPAAATAAGAWVGLHALAIFMALLLLALIATVGIWRHVQRGPRVGQRRWRVVALVLIGSGSALFILLALLLQPASGLTEFDLALSAAVLAQVPASVVRFFGWLTHAGDSATRTVLALGVGTALLLARRPVLALGFAAGLAGNGALTTLLKHAFGRERPLQPSGGLTAEGYSFPSGHSAGAMVAFGLLAYLALRLLPARWHLAALCAAVVMSLGIGASRVFIRAHFPSDVLAGFASGVAWLALCVLLMEAASQRWPRG